MKPGLLLGSLLLAMVLAFWALGLVKDFPVTGDAVHATSLSPLSYPCAPESREGLRANVSQECVLSSSEEQTNPRLWLGTDHNGRDVFRRLVMASQAFVLPGLMAAAIATFLGVFLGSLSGYLGGWAARGIGGLFTVVGSIPRLILALLASAVWGAEPYVLAWATGLAYIPAMGGAITGRIRALSEEDFVIAARAHGIPHWRILAVHLLWLNCRKLVARQVARVFGFFVVLEATLSYLDPLHFSPRYPTWGNMVASELTWPEGNNWAWIAPALAIWLTVLGANLVANHFREVHHE